MFRGLLIGSTILLLGFNFILADTYKAKIKEVDEGKRTVTFEVEGKDKKFSLTKDAKIYTTGKAAKGQPAPEILVPLVAAKDKDATVTTDKFDGKESVTAIKVEVVTKKKKKGKE